MPRNPNERPVKPHTLDRRQESLYRGTPRERQEAKRDIRNAVSRPGNPGKKSR